jgi:hypothetical protein
MVIIKQCVKFVELHLCKTPTRSIVIVMEYYNFNDNGLWVRYLPSMTRFADWTAEQLGFDFCQGKGLFSAAARRAPGPCEPPIHWVPGVLSPVVKGLGHEAARSLPSSAEVNNEWSPYRHLSIRLLA